MDPYVETLRHEVLPVVSDPGTPHPPFRQAQLCITGLVSSMMHSRCLAEAPKLTRYILLNSLLIPLFQRGEFLISPNPFLPNPAKRGTPFCKGRGGESHITPPAEPEA